MSSNELLVKYPNKTGKWDLCADNIRNIDRMFDLYVLGLNTPKIKMIFPKKEKLFSFIYISIYYTTHQLRFFSLMILS